MCSEFSKESEYITDNSIDLTITSPPYDSLRNYNGYIFNETAIIKQLYRITKIGGVVVWIVNDEVISGSESGQSFRQALLFKQNGFNIHDTMIYLKNTSSFPARRDGNRYTQIFEYCFIFSKGKPKTANLICDKENRWSGWVNWGKKTHRNKNGDLIETKDIKPVPQFSPRNNVWFYEVGYNYNQLDNSGHKHPAITPFLLVHDHIISWSNPGDLVLDPMCGSGTSCIAAKLLDRNYIGIDISTEYCELSENRLYQTNKQSYQSELNKKLEKENIKKRKQIEILEKLTYEERSILGFPAK